MSVSSEGSRESSRAAIQAFKDEVVLHVQNFSLAGRLLTIEIFEVQNAALGKPLSASVSPLRASPLPVDDSSSSSSSPRTSRTAGFRVWAVDEVENEYSLFVTRQRAEYLYQAEYPDEATACKFISLEAMANGILAHLTILGNRQRDMGKLACREPEPRVEKKERIVPTRSSPKKNKNPHLPSKRSDQRAVRVRKSSQRAKEAVASATRHLEYSLNGEGEEEEESTELTPRTIARQSSEASILHRMASADSKTMWKANLETNFEEPIHSLPLQEDASVVSAIQETNDSLKARQETDESFPLSGVKRAVPERKTKHRELYERRQKGRQQRILAAQAAQEPFSTAPLSFTQSEGSDILAFSSVAEESEEEGISSSRRSSRYLSQVASWEDKSSRSRASSAPRSSAVIGNAYALRHIGDDEENEVEQFLRRRTLNSMTRKSVLGDDKWDQHITGMGVEITQERPSRRKTLLESSTRRIAIVRALGTSGRPRPSSGPSTGRSSVGSPVSRGKLIGSSSLHSSPRLPEMMEEEQSNITHDKTDCASLSASVSDPALTFTAPVEPYAEESTQVKISSSPRSNSVGAGVHVGPQVRVITDPTGISSMELTEDSMLGTTAGDTIYAAKMTMTMDTASIAATVAPAPTASSVSTVAESEAEESSIAPSESHPVSDDQETTSAAAPIAAAGPLTQAFLSPLEPSPRPPPESLSEDASEEGGGGKENKAEPVLLDPEIEVYPSDVVVISSPRSASNDSPQTVRVLSARSGSSDSGKSVSIGSSGEADESSVNQELMGATMLQSQVEEAGACAMEVPSVPTADPNVVAQESNVVSDTKSPRTVQLLATEKVHQTCWEDPQLVVEAAAIPVNDTMTLSTDAEGTGGTVVTAQSPDSTGQDYCDKQCEVDAIQYPGEQGEPTGDRAASREDQECVNEEGGESLNEAETLAAVKKEHDDVHEPIAGGEHNIKCGSLAATGSEETIKLTLERPLPNNDTPQSGRSTGESVQPSVEGLSEPSEATSHESDVGSGDARNEKVPALEVIATAVIGTEQSARTAGGDEGDESNDKTYAANEADGDADDKSRFNQATSNCPDTGELSGSTHVDDCVGSSEYHSQADANDSCNDSYEANVASAENGRTVFTSEQNTSQIAHTGPEDAVQTRTPTLGGDECEACETQFDTGFKESDHLGVHEGDPVVVRKTYLDLNVEEPADDDAHCPHSDPIGQTNSIGGDSIPHGESNEAQLSLQENGQADDSKESTYLFEDVNDKTLEGFEQKDIAVEELPGYSEEESNAANLFKVGSKSEVQRLEPLDLADQKAFRASIDQSTASTHQEHLEGEKQVTQAGPISNFSKVTSPRGNVAAGDEEAAAVNEAKVLPQLPSPQIDELKSSPIPKAVAPRSSRILALTSALPSSTEATISLPKSHVSRQQSGHTQVVEAKAAGRSKPTLARGQTTRLIKETAVSRSMRRRSTGKRSSLPELSPTTVAKLSTHAMTKRNSDESPILTKTKSDRMPPTKRASQTPAVLQTLSNYHKKWSKWLAGRNIIEKIGCLQLEELVLADPHNEGNLVKLGLRYARWSGTSLYGIVLLEHASMMHKNAPRTHEYWFWMGSAHLDIFMRHRKFLPISRFHLEKSLQAFTRAFAYMESVADPLLLLRYAIGLFWSKGDGNLDKTNDIFHELLSRFVSFCDKDRVNLLFLQFQVLHRLKLYVDAIECMNKILELHQMLPRAVVSAKAPAAPASVPELGHQTAYEAADYKLMLMQCQQASGDYVPAAATLASIVKLKGLQQDSSLRDDQYFDLWFAVAEKCFQHEDYTLAMEYYAIALNFAKQSHVLAAIHYNLGLCFQSLGEDSKCVVEYKRARTSNRHVAALLPLTELSASYYERFALLLRKPIVQVIEEVRVDLYGRAVKRLQRVFRRNRNTVFTDASVGNTSPDVRVLGALQSSSASPKRGASKGSDRNLLSPAAIVEANEVTESDESPAPHQLAGPVGNGPEGPEDVATVVDHSRHHESFLARKQETALQIAELLANPHYRGRDSTPASPGQRVMPKMQSPMRSGLLAPEKDRPDVRRRQSMVAYRQLGYVSSTMPWVEFWETLLTLALELFESRRALHRCIARIRGLLPFVTHEVAFCSLAESIGNVDEAAEKLHDPIYERELTYVCSVIDVAKQMDRKFQLELVQLPQPTGSPVRLPTILSPVAEVQGSPGTRRSVGAIPSQSQSPSNRVVLPPYSPIRATSASTHRSKQLSPKRHLRVNQLLDMHFQHHVQQQEAAVAIAEATGASIQPQQRGESLEVLQDFRHANSVLLRSQLAFGTEKITI